jgi:hypothetical protein
MLYEHFRSSKSFLALKVIGNDRQSRAQSEASRRRNVISNCCHTNDAGFPAHAGADQETSHFRNVFQDFAKLSLHALGRQAGRLVQ